MSIWNGQHAPSAAARRHSPQDVTGPQLDRALFGQALREGLVAAGQQPVLTRRPGLPVGEPPPAVRPAAR